MSKLVWLFAFVALLEIANGLECFSCTKDTCKQDKDKWTKPHCNPVVGQNVVACETKTVTVNNEKITTRGCGTVVKTADGKMPEACTTILPTETEPKCTYCEKDYCNAATSINFSFFALTGAALTYLIFVH